MSFNKVLSKLQSKYADTIYSLEGVESTLNRVFLDSPQMNYALGGSWVDGRIYHFWGPESSGKTLLSMKIANEIQKRETKNNIIFVDFEHTFDIAFYKKIFPDFNFSKERFVYIDPFDGESAFEIVQALIETNEFGLVIWDSVATTPTSAVMSKEFGASSFGGTAKLMSEGLKKLNPYVHKFKTSIIFINQIRDSMNQYNPETQPSSKALNFYSSGTFRISKVELIKEKGVDIGIIMKAKNKKNKVGIPFREALLTFLFATGFNSDSEYIEFILNLNIDGWKQAGSWIKNDEKNVSLQGKDKFLAYLRENKEEFRVIKNTVNAQLTGQLESDKDSDEPDAIEQDV